MYYNTKLVNKNFYGVFVINIAVPIEIVYAMAILFAILTVIFWMFKGASLIAVIAVGILAITILSWVDIIFKKQRDYSFNTEKQD